ncbi:MAG: hypothetical protein F4Z76_03635 [Rhodothermaceae bacterium]|nr:hypothetical protein [Rhodothermaceae bacterium]MYE63852.1 hypothetical protein [Rhodothermaceae bacterium]
MWIPCPWMLTETNLGHDHRKFVLPFFATCGETGDVLGAKLRAGAQSDARGLNDFVLRIAHAVRMHGADRVMVRLDAGSNGTCAPLEAEGVYDLMRLARNPRLLQMAQPHLRDRTPDTVRYV